MDIAEQNNLDLNPRTYGKKETLAKCPFCHADQNKKKFYLSLNTEEQLFKCWHCKKSGGVLEFESLLTGKPFEEIRNKYFKKKRSYHKAERLSPRQLEKIGWNIRSKERDKFNANKDKVWSDWLAYEMETLSYLFAQFLLISMLNDRSRQVELVDYLKEQCEVSLVNNAYERIVAEYRLDKYKRNVWAQKGGSLASLVWSASQLEQDHQLEKLVIQLPFVYFLLQKELAKFQSAAI